MNDLDHRLDQARRGLILTVPLKTITARGVQLRRRRRTQGLAAALTAAVVLSGGVVGIRSVWHSPDSEPSALTALRGVAPSSGGWSTSLQGLPTADATKYAALCRAEFRRTRADQASSRSFNASPVATTLVRGGPYGVMPALIFRSGAAFSTCILRTDEPGGSRVMLLSTRPRLRPTGPVTSNGAYGGRAFEVATGIAGPGVSRVIIVINGKAIQAAVDHGTYAAIIPGNTSHQAYQDATVEALNAAGDRLGQVPLNSH